LCRTPLHRRAVKARAASNPSGGGIKVTRAEDFSPESEQLRAILSRMGLAPRTSLERINRFWLP
jgi:hypothetical protein